MTFLRLFNPSGGLPSLSSGSSVADFFEAWYVPALSQSKRRKPPNKATIDRRRAAVNWWSRLMSSNARPDGPALDEITEELVILFQQKLATATYRRGMSGAIRVLSPVTQTRTVEELLIVLSAAGPRSANRIRANLLADPPTIYVEPIHAWPKDTWTMTEARQIANAAIAHHPPKRHWRGNVDRYRLLARASLAMWYFTGHRASSYLGIQWQHVRESRPGEWFLTIPRSVKTSKPDRLAIHPQLLDAINRLRTSSTVSTSPIIDWPMQYRSLADHHFIWAQAAGLPSQRLLSIQAWRRLHADQIAQSGYATARQLTATSLGHSSADITETHYSAVRDVALLSLPNLF